MNYFDRKLYHGTDEKNLDITKEELEYKYRTCFNVCEICYDFLNKKHTGPASYIYPKIGKEEFEKTGALSGYAEYERTRYGDKLYQYGDYYLTSNEFKVKTSWGSLNSIFGEIGRNAYYMLKGCELYQDFTLSLGIDDVENIKRFNELPQDKKPLIVIYEKVPKKLLLDEYGDEIEWNEDEPYIQNFRVKQENVYELYKYRTEIIYL